MPLSCLFLFCRESHKPKQLTMFTESRRNKCAINRLSTLADVVKLTCFSASFMYISVQIDGHSFVRKYRLCVGHSLFKQHRFCVFLIWIHCLNSEICGHSFYKADTKMCYVSVVSIANVLSNNANKMEDFSWWLLTLPSRLRGLSDSY